MDIDNKRIYFYSNFIKVDCQEHSPQAFQRAAHKYLDKIADKAPEWWPKWKDLVFMVHEELNKQYGKIDP